MNNISLNKNNIIILLGVALAAILVLTFFIFSGGENKESMDKEPRTDVKERVVIGGYSSV